MKRLFKILLWFVLLSAASAVSAAVVRKRNPEFGDEADGRFAVVAAMDGREFASSAAPLAEGSALAYMGGIELDLSGAEIDGGAKLGLTAIMGGIDVTVPPEWRVEVITESVAGGIANLTDPDSPADGPLLVVNARAIMGGIAIRTDEAG